jgi:Protein of unknown function (DUF3152)
MSTENHIKSGLTIVHLNAPELSRRTEKRVVDLDVASEPETIRKSTKRKALKVTRFDAKFALVGAIIGLLSVGLVLLDGSSTRADSITSKSLTVTETSAQPKPVTPPPTEAPTTTAPASEVQGTSVGASPVSAKVPAKSYTYKVIYQTTNRSDQTVFKTIARETLNDARGWQTAGLDFAESGSDDADFELILSEPEFLPAYSESCSVEYSCRVGKQVIINAKYWRESRPELNVPLLTYRQMVINHEVGHWLGLDHLDCPAPGEPAPVMQQQSIALNGCVVNPWPLESEVGLIAKSND